jgi:hypothetical protein
MNDRIRELAEQAGIEFDDDFSLEPETIYYLKLSDFEKFAELIVREVFAKIEDERFEIYQPVEEAVKKHFGVKE